MCSRRSSYSSYNPDYSKIFKSRNMWRQNHRAVWVGRDLKDHPVSATLGLKQGHLSLD